MALRSKLILSLSAIAVLCAVLLWPGTAESPVEAVDFPDSVRVEHDLVRAPVVAVPPPAPAPAAAARPAAARIAATPAAAPPAPKNVRSREPERPQNPVVRFIAGDGRYRPEPFPRPDR